MNTGKRAYKKGTFGYWWTVEQGREDIADVHYRGSINCINNLDITSCEGMPARISGGLNLSGCRNLKNLPETLRVGGNLTLIGCSSLRELPRKLQVGHGLLLIGCHSLSKLPEMMRIGGDLSLTNCFSMKINPKTCDIRGRIYCEKGKDITCFVWKRNIFIRMKEFLLVAIDILKEIGR